ncbi:hypothetical protein HA402_013310 [Bradysia odoriphaga]|nr:hypothetical protein HA402_013310 [Bradysia odoriphaga]
MQLRNAGRKPHGRRYFPKEKSLCLALYKSGPRSYRFQERFLALPTLSTLGRHCANLMFSAGISPNLFAFIKEKVGNWSEKELCCTLGFDETALKTRTEYNNSTDEIDGFVELAGIRKPVFATHALVFMVRGIYKPFKQAVAFYYTHGLKSFELAELLILVTEAVLDTGLNVIGTVSDQVKINESTIHYLMDRDFIRSPGGLLQFKVQGKTIIHCYDVPHLLKVERNNLLIKNMTHCIQNRWEISGLNDIGEQQVASWQDVAAVFGIDQVAYPRLLPNIKDEHIKPIKLKMKVCVATQVFSQTYGNTMLQAVQKKQLRSEAVGTAQILFFFNDLFDSMNGDGPVEPGSLKGSINKDSVHFAYWEYALKMLSKMNFLEDCK